MLLGDTASRSPVLMRLIYDRIEELGLPRDAIRLLTEAGASTRTKKIPTIPIFFGYSGASDNDHPEISSFLEDSNYFISIVSSLAN